MLSFFESEVSPMPILNSYYQEVYRSPVVRLDGYSGRHGLEAG